MHLPTMSIDLQLPLSPLDRPSPSETAAASGDFFQDPDRGCRTPTSEEYKVPALIRCPPPPKKVRSRLSCGRKGPQMRFFEDEARDQIEEFFRSRERCGSPDGEIAMKRRRLFQ